MRLYFLAALAVIPVNLCSDSLEELYEAGDYKAAAAAYRELAEAEQASVIDRSVYLSKVAAACYRDQDDTGAFEAAIASFQLLEQGTVERPLTSSAHYQSAIGYYLASNWAVNRAKAVEFVKLYGEVADSAPGDQLNFLVAAAYANLGMFDQVFQRLQNVIASNPHHFLAYKSRALMHVRLMERLSDPIDRETHRREAERLIDLSGAVSAGEDPSLPKLKISLASPAARGQIVALVIDQIVSGSTPVPRRDIPFYVQEALKVDSPDLAARFVEKVASWYDYSRSITIAERAIMTYRERHSEDLEGRR